MKDKELLNLPVGALLILKNTSTRVRFVRRALTPAPHGHRVLVTVTLADGTGVRVLPDELREPRHTITRVRPGRYELFDEVSNYAPFYAQRVFKKDGWDRSGWLVNDGINENICEDKATALADLKALGDELMALYLARLDKLRAEQRKA